MERVIGIGTRGIQLGNASGSELWSVENAVESTGLRSMPRWSKQAWRTEQDRAQPRSSCAAEWLAGVNPGTTQAGRRIRELIRDSCSVALR